MSKMNGIELIDDYPVELRSVIVSIKMRTRAVEQIKKAILDRNHEVG